MYDANFVENYISNLEMIGVRTEVYRKHLVFLVYHIYIVTLVHRR